jgi:oligopeptidase B
MKLLLPLLLSVSAVWAQVAAPPVAKQIPYEHKTHGDVRQDPYFWMKERDTAPVLDYLKAENAYFESYMKPTEPLQKKLYAELRGRIKEADVSAPVKDGAYEYYTRTREGEDYPVFCRKKFGDASAAEQVMLDVNVLAKGQDYYAVPGYQVSPDGRWLAYPVDTKGRRFYTWHFKNLETGQDAPDLIENVTPNLAWAADSKTVYYASQHPETLRSDKVWRRALGQKQAELVYFEEDETFNVWVSLSLTKKYIFIGSSSTTSRETRYTSADPAQFSLKTFLPREKNHEYEVQDGGDRFYVLTNWKARNFRVMEAPYENTDKDAWKEVVAHDKDALLELMLPIKTHLVLMQRSGGLTQIRLVDRATKKTEYLTFKDEVFVVAPGAMEEYDTPYVRYDYESLSTPPSTYDYELTTGRHLLRKQKEVLGGFKTENYESKRLWIKARDGEQVPVSLVYRKELFKKGTNPALVYGYGSYGLSTDPDFRQSVISLLDRGFVYAIPHIRGGSEMGRKWYENGRQDHKLNTFQDFIDATDALVKDGWIQKGRVYAMGGSAGGLLMGGVANMRPDLYRGVLAMVPFVDALTTMLDSSIPLTTEEYDEWGNPNDPKFYDYIKKYSPYDNVGAYDYPAMYVETGYHDSQVQYWEPAKWVARLRARNKGPRPVLFRVEMAAGHSGRTGRFVRLEQTARAYAFILSQEGLQ